MELLFFYPLAMTVVYLVGLIMYYIIIELPYRPVVDKDIQEGISFLIPCFNEEHTIEQTVLNLSQLSFENKELIVINDGSTDGTLAVIERLKESYPITILNFGENRGKAHGLNAALEYTKYDYVMCIDADTVIDDDAPYYMLEQFRKNQNVGAVTGNPRIRNKRNLIERLQILEYASIVGAIKKQQSLTGYVNTVSGVFVLFSKKAIHAVGGWDIDMITEDIAISWKMHLEDWLIIYEPRALCYMIAPNTLGGLFKQRIRWAQGGQEVVWRDGLKVIKKGNIPFILLLLEQLSSTLWSVSLMLTLVFTSVNHLVQLEGFQDVNLILTSTFMLVTFNVIFFSISLLVDSRCEKINLIYLLYLPWYPLFYWLLNAIASFVALPKSLTRKKGAYATWTSPDR